MKGKRSGTRMREGSNMQCGREAGREKGIV
jgi:hypothetical protein